MEVKLNDEQLSRAMDSAILTAIGEEGRKQIIQNAVSYLVKRPETSFSGRQMPSPLEDILQRTAASFAQKIIQGELEKDGEFMKQVKQLYSDSFEKVFVTDRETLISRISGKMSEIFQGR